MGPSDPSARSTDTSPRLPGGSDGSSVPARQAPGGAPPEQGQTTRDYMRFLVYIVESPSPEDLYSGRTEGDVLARTLGLAEIPREYRLALTKDLFRVALGSDVQDALVRHGQGHPIPPHLILHVSAHGNQQGIMLTSGEFIDWREFGDIVGPVHELVRDTLVVCMSSCEGFAALLSALADGPPPFLVVVGPVGKPTWSDTTAGYVAFYHVFEKTLDPARALDALNAASGFPSFRLVTAATVRQAAQGSRTPERASDQQTQV